MGASLSCIDGVPSLQRLQYDMSPIKTKTLPIVWLLGLPGAGKNTQARLLCENLQFEEIQVGAMIEEESTKDTDRATLIKESLNSRNKKIPDAIVVDLIKEEMLRKSQSAKGFVVNNFPKTPKQASIFVKEIDEPDAIIYLTTSGTEMVKRYQSNSSFDEETIKKMMATYAREVKECVSKFGNKLEKIDCNEPPASVYEKIEAAVNVRISTKTKITAESDYAQCQSQEMTEML